MSDGYYKSKIDHSSEHYHKESRKGRDIGPLPPIKNKQRRAEAEASLLQYLKQYKPAAYNLAFSQSHLELIQHLENIITHGGQRAFALPRGDGKTTITIGAAEWAISTGRRRFVTLIGATEPAAEKLLKNIKTNFTNNKLLHEDFPEISLPIKKLENQPLRCRGQLLDGNPTNMVWGAKMLVFPTVLGSNASGSVISVCGLTGNVRGQQHELPSGEVIRPDMAICDDPQTRESANSPTQTQTRRDIIFGDVMGLAGPGVQIALAIPCTVIVPGDLSDQLLDREKNPELVGIKKGMVIRWPEHEKLWEEYGELRIADLLNEDMQLPTATEFYRKNRDKMDEGSLVNWPARKSDWELSALQHAYNMRFKLGDDAFFSEYQNDPIDHSQDDNEFIQPDQLAAKQNGLPKGKVSVDTRVLTAFIDVQKKALYYGVCWWADGFNGGVCDYGVYPKQPRRNFELRKLKKTLQQAHPGTGEEGACRAGLIQLIEEICGRDFVCQEDGSRHQVKRLFVDTNYRTDLVHDVVNSTTYKSVVMPYHGRPIGPSDTPYSHRKQQRGEKIGNEWMIPTTKKKRLARHVRVDVNYWKTKIFARLGTALGDSGCLSLYTDKAGARHHEEFGHQVAGSEVPNKTYGKERMVIEWKLPPNQPDNHFLDILVGCGVGASMEGITLKGETPINANRRRRQVVEIPEHLLT